MKNYEWWLCHKYDVNYMIMQGNMTMMMCVMVMNGTVEKLHGNISRNGYGNAIIGRYGGCFEKDIRRSCVIDHIVSHGLDAPAKFAPTLKVRKGNARYRRG